MSTTETTTPLIPQLEALRVHLDAIRTQAEGFRDFTPTQWLWSPGPKVWSVALILDHLNAVERKVAPPIARAVEALRRDDRRGSGPFRYRWTDRFFIRLLSPNPPIKSPVPPDFAPKAPVDPLVEVLDPFLEHVERYLRLIESANGYDLKGLKVASPVSSLIKVTVGAYLEALVAHERYHWTQVDALLTDPAFPK